VLNVTTPADQYDFMLVDLDNGVVAATYNHAQTNDDDANPGQGGATELHASFRNGRLIVPAGIVADTTSPTPKPISHLRVYYRGTADWAVAVQRAPAQYASVLTLPGIATTAATPPYFQNPDALVPGKPNKITDIPITPNLYYSDVAATTPSGPGHTIYFPFCDVGKGITLTNTVVTLDTTGPQITVPTCDLDMTLPSTQVKTNYVSYDLLEQQAIKTPSRR